MIPQWLSVGDAAKRLGVSVADVRDLIKTGELKARRTNGGQVVFLEEEEAADESQSTIMVQALIAKLRGQVAAKEEHLQAREQELLRMADQLRAKDQQIERLMVLLAQVQNQAQELAQRLLPMPPAPAAAPTPPSAPAREPNPRRRWWPFQRRD